MDTHRAYLSILIPAILFACRENQSTPDQALIDDLHLKKGRIISCGPPDKEFGTVRFEVSCGEKVQNDFNVALALLHSFEYDEAEKKFAEIIDRSPGCAMAYWGIAMSSYHPLWEPPAESELQKGSKAVRIAGSLDKKSEIESGFIGAIAAYYGNWEKTDPRSRNLKFEKAMESLYNRFPDNLEVAVFYTLALNASADPSDASYTNQKKAGPILEALYQEQPDHPGIIHYIIHTYDYPGIADLALPAATRYAQVAPSSAHALHMPSHIFTRLGMWDECVEINLRSVDAAKCYAEAAGIRGHWDEELHGLDYVVYAYLQQGNDAAVRKQLDYLKTIDEVYPVNFKVAYTFAAAPSRAALESKNWQEAAGLQIHPADFPWQKFPWQESIIHFTRLLGSVHTGDMPAARLELLKLQMLHDTLVRQKDVYKSKQVAIQLKAGEAWLVFMSGKKAEALDLMNSAADMEDSTSKHPVTPGEVLPARELYAEMLLSDKQYIKALQEYEKVLKKSPGRFNSLYGAAVSAEKSGYMEKAVFFFKELSSTAAEESQRKELIIARQFLQNQGE